MEHAVGEQSWASVEAHFFIAARYWCQVNDHLHFKAFKCCKTYYNNKMRVANVYGFYAVFKK